MARKKKKKRKRFFKTKHQRRMVKVTKQMQKDGVKPFTKAWGKEFKKRMK